MAEEKRKPDRSVVIILIAIFKLFKALLLLGVGIGIFKLAGKDLGDTLTHWAKSMGVDPENKLLQRLLAHTLNINKSKLEWIGTGLFVYAAMFGTEGTGLLMGKRWAEWMVVLTTSGLMPIEIYEIYEKPTALRIGTLVINALAVVYLIVRLKNTAGGERPASADATSPNAQPAAAIHPS